MSGVICSGVICSGVYVQEVYFWGGAVPGKFMSWGFLTKNRFLLGRKVEGAWSVCHCLEPIILFKARMWTSKMGPLSMIGREWGGMGWGWDVLVS